MARIAGRDALAGMGSREAELVDKIDGAVISMDLSRLAEGHVSYYSAISGDFTASEILALLPEETLVYEKEERGGFQRYRGKKGFDVAVRDGLFVLGTDGLREVGLSLLRGGNGAVLEETGVRKLVERVGNGELIGVLLEPTMRATVGADARVKVAAMLFTRVAEEGRSRLGFRLAAECEDDRGARALLEGLRRYWREGLEDGLVSIGRSGVDDALVTAEGEVLKTDVGGLLPKIFPVRE
jgi:hypothetical protein